MRLSKSRFKKAVYYLDRPGKIDELSKYVLVNELQDFGICIDPDASDLDVFALQDIFRIVLNRIGTKYSKEVKACH